VKPECAMIAWLMRALARSLALLSATTFLLLAACDKKTDDKKVDDKKADDKKADDKKADDEKAEVAQPEEPKPATAGVLALGAVKIFEKDKPDEAIELLADGTLKVGPTPDKTLKVSTDGKLSNAEGIVVAQVGADGVVTIDGKASGVVLSDTGLTMTGPDGKAGTAKFLEDGTIVVDPAPPENLQMVAQGCTGPMVKTCGLILTMLLLMSSDEPTAASGGVEIGPDPKLADPK
jgi:hypothetical protein